MSTELARNGDQPSTEVALAIAGTMEQLKAIRTFIKEEFIEGTDFGKIPGCGPKPTLYLPGAQKSTMYFNCFPTYKIKKDDLGTGHVEFTIRCLLFSRGSRDQVGEGVGCCSTMESKYRFRKAEKVCPKCGQNAIIRGKAEYGGGWICFEKKGGCKAKFADNAQAITSQPEGLVENEDLWGIRNTILKMAKKRAFVDAAITLGCLSELFTQDIEDTYAVQDVQAASHIVDGEVVAEYRPTPPERPQAAPAAPESAPAKESKFPDQGSGYGRTGSYASKEETNRFYGLLDKVADVEGEHWADVWISSNRDFPPEVPELPYRREGMIGHLFKRAIKEGKLKPVGMTLDAETGMPVEKASTDQKGQMVAIVLGRDKDWLIDAIRAYVSRETTIVAKKLVAKHPHLSLPPDYDFDDAGPDPAQAASEAQAGTTDEWKDSRE